MLSTETCCTKLALLVNEVGAETFLRLLYYKTERLTLALLNKIASRG